MASCTVYARRERERERERESCNMKLQHRTLQELMAGDKDGIKEDLSSNDGWCDGPTEHADDHWLQSNSHNKNDARSAQHETLCIINEYNLKVAAADEVKKEEGGEANKKLVRLFHVALEAGNVAALRSLLADSLDWWFHGAPRHQHLRRVLTGRRTVRSLGGHLVPLRMLAVGPDVVLVEGCGPQRDTSWAHVWTLRAGRLVQLREYWGVGLRVLRFESDHPDHHHNHDDNHHHHHHHDPHHHHDDHHHDHDHNHHHHRHQDNPRFVWESSLWSATPCTPGLILTI